MSRNYGPNAAPGQLRTRIWKIEGVNINRLSDPDAVPYLNLYEEDAIQLAAPAASGATELSLGPSRPMIQLFYNPAKVIAIRNPADDSLGPVGRLPATLTMAEAYAILYSLGRQAQVEQDAVEAAS